MDAVEEDLKDKIPKLAAAAAAAAKSLQSTLRNPMNCSPPGPPSMGFSRQEYWSGVPLASPSQT